MDVLPRRRDENRRVISIEGGPNKRSPPSKLVKGVVVRRDIEDLLQSVDCDDEKQGRERVSLPKSTTMEDRGPGNTIEKNA